MSVSVQKRGKRFQLRVKHRQLPRGQWFHPFDDEQRARDYGEQLHRLLDQGIVPAELLAKTDRQDDPLLVEVIRAYVKGCNALTPSDDDLLGTMLEELVGVRLGDATYAWAERYVQGLKRDRNLAPGTIRKRVGALRRVVDWHLRTTEKAGANSFKLLPTGYSQYTDQDRAALKLGQAVRVDERRDRRLHSGEEDKIRPFLGNLELLFGVIVDTGLRLREAYRLRVDQVDVAKGVLRVEGSKARRGVLKPRLVPLKPELRERLREHCTGRVGLLFPFWDGTPEDLDACTSRLSTAFSAAFKAAGCAGLTEHDLRHEATCRWFELRDQRGLWVFSDVEVCRIMGWADTKMAVRYASLRGEDLAARLAPAPAA